MKTKTTRTNLRNITLAIVYAGALALVTGHTAAQAEAAGIFGYSETPNQGLKPFPKWTGALERYFEDKGENSGQCEESIFNSCHYQEWTNMLESVRESSPDDQLNEINYYMNRYKYIVDPINWGVDDYWAIPPQFFKKYGDCEDYAIAKYLSLRALGWDADQMRIIVLQDMNLRVAHAILAVYREGKILVLDNQTSRVVESGRINHYKPIFSLNENGWWRHRIKKRN